MTYAKVRKSFVVTLFCCKCFVFWLENATSERVWNLLANLSFQHKIKIYLVKKLDSSHWINFWFFIRFLMRLSMPKGLSVTEYSHKICSKNHKLCIVKMKYQSPQKMAKNKIFFFQKEHTHNTKDERTISKGLGQLGLAW